jgi:cytoskeletal protein CcmA (bactofilin family)
MNKKRALSWVGGILLLVLLLARLVVPARAFTPMQGDTVVIQEGEVIDDDLYVSANLITVNGTIKGDLVAFGSLITLGPSGVVEGDMIAAGQGVTIEGTVQDDVRMAGMVLSVGDGAVIGDDLLAAGYNLQVSRGSQVGGDIVAVASTINLAGNSGGSVLVNGNGLQIDGSVAHNVNASVGGAQDGPPFSPLMFMRPIPGMPTAAPVPGGLTLGPNAKIGGNLEYTSPQQASIPAGAVSGKVNYVSPPAQPAAQAEQAAATENKTLTWFVNLLRSLATLLLMGMLFMYLLPKPVQYGASTLTARLLPSLGWGLLAYIGFFFAEFLILVVTGIVAVLFGMVTLGDLVGVTVASGIWLLYTLALAFKIITSYLARLVVAYCLGNWLFKRFMPRLAESRFWPAVLGIFLIVLLASIPWVGGWINFIVILFGFGALALVAREWYRARRYPRSL